MTYRIRRMAAGEWRELRAIRLEALRDSPKAFSESFAEAAARDDAFWQAKAATEATSAEAALFVARDRSGAWVGTAGAAPIPGIPDHAHVHGVYVSPAHRGPDGPAVALMDAAIDFAREHTGAAWLTLGVHEDNPRAQAFYRRLGFTDTGKVIPYMLDPSEKLHILGYAGFRGPVV
ncbi:GNAT family N-acetyltransferase [Kitasatospora sp. CM 4170]|uniref:GNAT family N-acetyltransferase n=1 Tax=Kitasatospora aburaviensis TaxID=67265 RepID=A0ABW1F5U0_9ACTN|nr:GNAT family N-acetyltransferase [Kitasatospora sp. CM 4170]WNM43288.1 GNAT family N-acetyltransferase [Kitasatospora sp. CM 4170]